jgi:hypothetical protein
MHGSCRYSFSAGKFNTVFSSTYNSGQQTVFQWTAPELAQALLESADIPLQIRAKTLNSSPDSISILLKVNPILGVQNSPESVRNVRLWVDLLLLTIPV